MQFFGLQVASVLSLFSTLASCATEPHMVSVGKDGLKMTPSTLNVAVGDKVTFKFFPKTHSVARGSFNDPCKPLSETSFFSGGFNTTDANGNATTFTITIEDTLPIYYYCVFPTHCGKGMVGIINPNADGSQSLSEYIANAANKTTVPSPKVQGGVLSTPDMPNMSTMSDHSSTSPTATSSHGSMHSGSMTATSTGTSSASATSRGNVNSAAVPGATPPFSSQWFVIGFVGLSSVLVDGLML